MMTDWIMMGKHINSAPRRHRRRLVVLVYAVFCALILASLCGYANMLLVLAFVVVVRWLGEEAAPAGSFPLLCAAMSVNGTGATTPISWLIGGWILS